MASEFLQHPFKIGTTTFILLHLELYALILNQICGLLVCKIFLWHVAQLRQYNKGALKKATMSSVHTVDISKCQNISVTLLQLFSSSSLYFFFTPC